VPVGGGIGMQTEKRKRGGNDEYIRVNREEKPRKKRNNAQSYESRRQRAKTTKDRGKLAW
jgi:hypothetical protein